MMFSVMTTRFCAPPLALVMIASLVAEGLWTAPGVAQDASMQVDDIERVGPEALFRSRPTQLSITQGETVVVRNLPRPYLRAVAARPVAGAFLVMWSERITATGVTAVEESVHLVNDEGQVMESWEMPEGVVSISAPGRRAYVLTGGRTRSVFRLDPGGKRTLVERGTSRDWQVLGGPQGKLVLCRQTDMRKDRQDTELTAANCRSQLGWSFDGTWFRVDPITCGEWLVEPVQDATARFGDAKYDRTVALQVRSLVDGSVRTRAQVAASKLRCLDGKWLFDVGSQKRFLLPALTEPTDMKCGKHSASSVAQRGTPAACVSDRGEPGLLVEAR